MFHMKQTKNNHLDYTKKQEQIKQQTESSEKP